MAITYKEVRDDRQWKASTGLSQQQFFSLLKHFDQAYDQYLDYRCKSVKITLPTRLLLRRTKTYFFSRSTASKVV